ncbi:MAG: hypothetical protein E7426_07100 [Ruminococcaceae bacterium]|jgi:hypothetical protein|nr:hypothetical protein [Oscillospiraceae bacterium]
MSRRYRKRRRNPLPLLAAAVVVIGLGVVLLIHFLHPSDRIEPDGNQQENAENTAPDNTENTENTTPDNTENTENTTPDNSENTENTTPDNSENTEPEPYEVIELTGDTQRYDAVYRVGDAGFEMYTYVPEVGEKYASAVNTAADELQGAADVYAITVPLSSGITLPDELQGGIFGDQKSAEEKIDAMLGGNVKSVPLYDTLMRHRTEYVYFRTDHHWTALGAYYAYCNFCRIKGIEPHQLADYEAEEFTGFLGSFYRDSGHSEEIGSHPDTVEVYHPVSREASLDFTGTDGKTIHWQIIYDVSNWNAEMKYNTFIGGDNPYTVITNPDVTDGSSCVVVKESFGNAFVPYLVDHYQTVYVVDYRYWGGDLTDFARENGVQDVVFINNLSAIRSNYLMGKLQGIL